ncbi:hypothetical protein [uncultured Psychrobacter sp.]|uniref:hypothetical protein n=1 Tax=uncultured Psychrobacter sp. TaxID=259303 RepID=UPI00345AD3CD
MGFWITIIIILFVLGSMMALKPNGIDQRLDKLRMSARRLQLNPKLVVCPDWIKGKDNEYGRGMIGQYCLIIDNVKLPQSRYQVIDGQWRPYASIDNNEQPIHANFSLDKTPLALPTAIEPFVKGLAVKANSIIVYWEDINYVRPITNPNYKTGAIEPDLLALKQNLEQWALQMQASSHGLSKSSMARTGT